MLRNCLSQKKKIVKIGKVRREATGKYSNSTNSPWIGLVEEEDSSRLCGFSVIHRASKAGIRCSVIAGRYPRPVYLFSSVEVAFDSFGPPS